jgi:hypothetical protein
MNIMKEGMCVKENNTICACIFRYQLVGTSRKLGRGIASGDNKEGNHEIIKYSEKKKPWDFEIAKLATPLFFFVICLLEQPCFFSGACSQSSHMDPGFLKSRFRTTLPH